jgi:hypothetical protein
MRRHYGIAHRADGYLSPAAQRLVALLKAEGKRMRSFTPSSPVTNDPCAGRGKTKGLLGSEALFASFSPWRTSYRK